MVVKNNTVRRVGVVKKLNGRLELFLTGERNVTFSMQVRKANGSGQVVQVVQAS